MTDATARRDETMWTTLAAGKVERLLGPEKARVTVATVLAELGLSALQSADDLGRFGDALVLRGGFLGALGGVAADAGAHAPHAAGRGSQDPLTTPPATTCC